MFGKKKEVYNGAEILERYDQGKLSADDFIREFGKVQVYYSTAYGDFDDGRTGLFLLPGPNGTGYYPVFSSEKYMKEFFEKSKRSRYMILENTFSSFLSIVKKTNDGGAPVKMGAVIDPGYSGITIDLPFLEMAVRLSKE